MIAIILYKNDEFHSVYAHTEDDDLELVYKQIMSDLNLVGVLEINEDDGYEGVLNTGNDIYIFEYQFLDSGLELIYRK